MTITTILRRMSLPFVALVPLFVGGARSEEVAIYPEETASPALAIEARQAPHGDERPALGFPAGPVSPTGEEGAARARRDDESGRDCGPSLGLLERLVACRSADLWKALP